MNAPELKLDDQTGFAAPPGSASLPPVLDVCCGPKGMWFNKHDPRAMFADRRREYWKMVHPSGTRTANIDPDIIADFTDLPFPDESFALVVMDPPHIPQETTTGMVVRQYGNLAGDWRGMLKKGFAECFRVLRPDGVLIFKWNECRISVKDILPLSPEPPLFGHLSGKRMQTHWIAFLKPQHKWVCSNCGNTEYSEREIICWKCGKGEMLYEPNDKLRDAAQ